MESLQNNEKKVHSLINDLIRNVTSNSIIEVQTSYTQILALLSDTELDFVSLYQEIFTDPTAPIWAKIIINRAANTHIEAMIPSMHFSAMMCELIQIGKDYRTLKK